MTKKERNKMLKELEAAQDKATLAFWEATEAHYHAKNALYLAECAMSSAKADYLHLKVRGTLRGMSYAK